MSAELRGRWARSGDADAGGARTGLLLDVLAGLLVLSIATQLVQLVTFALERDPTQLAWWAVNAGFALTCLGLRSVARRGRPRLAAGVLTGMVGALALALLLADGASNSMWAIVACLELLLAAVLLGGRAAAGFYAGTATAVLGVVALQDLGDLSPLVEEESQQGTDLTQGAGIVAVLGFIALLVARHVRGERVEAEADAADPPRAAARRVRTKDLSAREVEVVQLVAAGLSNEAIGRRLYVSPRTVQTHIANAMRKTGAANRTELGVLALREGLVPLEPDAELSVAGHRPADPSSV